MQNPFEKFMTDTVFLLKANGVKLGPYKSSLIGNHCAIDDKTLDIDHGDTIIRPLPNGKEEHYTVLRADFREDFGAIIGGFDMTLEKKQQILKTPSKVVNNISINNSREFQIGNENSQIININVQELAEQVAKSDDTEAKGLLRQLLGNETVSGIIGEGVSTLLGIISA